MQKLHLYKKDCINAKKNKNVENMSCKLSLDAKTFII
jgi:hypothetical protein